MVYRAGVSYWDDGYSDGMHPGLLRLASIFVAAQKTAEERERAQKNVSPKNVAPRMYRAELETVPDRVSGYGERVRGRRSENRWDFASSREERIQPVKYNMPSNADRSMWKSGVSKSNSPVKLDNGLTNFRPSYGQKRGNHAALLLPNTPSFVDPDLGELKRRVHSSIEFARLQQQVAEQNARNRAAGESMQRELAKRQALEKDIEAFARKRVKEVAENHPDIFEPLKKTQGLAQPGTPHFPSQNWDAYSSATQKSSGVFNALSEPGAPDETADILFTLFPIGPELKGIELALARLGARERLHLLKALKNFEQQLAPEGIGRALSGLSAREQLHVLKHILLNFEQQVGPLAYRKWRASRRTLPHFPDIQLQSKYKHAVEDFDFPKNYNPQNAESFKDKMIEHIQDPGTMMKAGTHRKTEKAIIYYNPKNEKMVMTHPNGEFWSAWKLDPVQIEDFLLRGNVQ